MQNGQRTAYEILGVHPSAPPELVNACYWILTRNLQDKRKTDPEADGSLFELTSAYEQLSDPDRRAHYDDAIGLSTQSLIRRPLPRVRFPRSLWHGRRKRLPSVDPYEVLGLLPGAPQSCLDEAREIMRTAYLRLPPESERRRILLELLNESYNLLRDPARRSQLPAVAIIRPAESATVEPEDASASTASTDVAPKPAPARRPQRGRDIAKKGDRTAASIGPDDAAIDVVIHERAPQPPVNEKPSETAAGALKEKEGTSLRTRSGRAVRGAAAAAGFVAGWVIKGLAWVLVALLRGIILILGVIVALLQRIFDRDGSSTSPAAASSPHSSEQAGSPPASADDLFLNRLASRVDSPHIAAGEPESRDTGSSS